jgi:hypothetical protein
MLQLLAYTEEKKQLARRRINKKNNLFTFKPTVEYYLHFDYIVINK